MSNCKMVLPKLSLQRVQRFWDKTVPTDYPLSNTEFSLSFDSDEVTVAVKSMEEALNTESSIITNDMVTTGQRIGSYLGTYNVTGEPGVLSLISPEKVSDNAIGVLAFHYNEETKAWDKIENVEIKDGYVYATLYSYSPIAIFTIKRDTVLDESTDLLGAPLFVANGIPVVIKKNENDEIVATDANGKETIIPSNCIIIGGTVDGSDIDSASVFINGVKLKEVIGGSINTEKNMKVKSINVTIENSEVINIFGGRYNCRVEENNFTIINTKCKYFGVGGSYLDTIKKDSNTLMSIGLGSNSWSKKANINIKNCIIDTLYAAGSTGYFYAKDSTVNINGGKYHYVITGGSNGKSENMIVNISNAEVDTYQTVNRGIVNNCKSVINNCIIDKLFVAADSFDPTVNGSVSGINYDITGGKVTLYAGTNNGKVLDTLTAHNIVDSLKISRTTELLYGESNTIYVIGDLIKIK